METLEQVAKKIVEYMGFSDYRLETNKDPRRGAIYIYDSAEVVKSNLPVIVESINHLLQMVAKKTEQPQVFFDVNNYRQEREGLIAELARAAAKKATQTKEKISLPAMNSYERRLVHVELAVHPEVTTESAGEGKERYVIVKPLEENRK
jgi:predicted RNA-binding protein Jag